MMISLIRIHSGWLPTHPLGAPKKTTKIECRWELTMTSLSGTTLLLRRNIAGKNQIWSCLKRPKRGWCLNWKWRWISIWTQGIWTCLRGERKICEIKIALSDTLSDSIQSLILAKKWFDSIFDSILLTQSWIQTILTIFQFKINSSRVKTPNKQ